MNQFNVVELDNPKKLIWNNKLLLNKNEFESLARKCIDLNCTGRDGHRLIDYISIWQCDLETVKLLVVNGVEINYVRPIHYICWNLGDK